ncbi:glutathione S-transferase [Xylariomycetidae sp. FL0641]|nr:glutathione S-transferase [Xylariomycetidae sp. FL0641]
MAPFGQIYSYPGNFRVFRAQVLAAINGLEVTTVPDFKIETIKTPEFLAKFPMGKIPAFEGADGFCLMEGGAIADYVARSGPKAAQLVGADAKAQSKVAQWTLFAETELSPGLLPIVAMCVMKVYEADQKRYDSCLANLVRALKALDASLADGRKWLVGDSLTLADVEVAGCLPIAFEHIIDPEIRKDIPHVVKYLQNFFTVPEVKSVYGELKMAEKRCSLP